MNRGDVVRHARPRAVRGENGGSLFRSPEGVSAARLNGAVGCKGPRRGTAGVGEQHDNFIRADADARANDADALLCEARDRPERHRGIASVTDDRFVKLGVTP